MLLFSLLRVSAAGSAAVESSSVHDLRAAVVAQSKKYVGTPYKYGGIGPDAFDCSGFIYTVAREAAGCQLPRTSKALYSYVKVIPESGLEKGDIVFFRTTGTGGISHAGIYIGNKQFIHAVSDGPNTGVIISSLNENYWRSKYAGSGKFLPQEGAADDDEQVEEIPVTAAGTARKTEQGENRAAARRLSARTTSGSGGSFASSLVLDMTAGVDWSFFTANKVMLNFRGVPLTANLRSVQWPLQPGIGITARFNTGVGAFQLPIVISATVNDYFRVYAGPVITLGHPELPGKDDDIKGSFFPGIIGVSWQTPSFTKGDIKVTLVQDISYTVFNETDGSALSPKNSFAAGLLFSTGVRVTLPFSSFLQ
jgi:hypothetical protein